MVRSSTKYLIVGSFPGTSCPSFFSTHCSQFVFTPGGSVCARARVCVCVCVFAVWCICHPGVRVQPEHDPKSSSKDLSVTWVTMKWFDLISYLTGQGRFWLICGLEENVTGVTALQFHTFIDITLWKRLHTWGTPRKGGSSRQPPTPVKPQARCFPLYCMKIIKHRPGTLYNTRVNILSC